LEGVRKGVKIRLDGKMKWPRWCDTCDVGPLKRGPDWTPGFKQYSGAGNKK